MMGAPNPALQAITHLMALCNDCQRFHEIETPVGHLMARLDEWHTRHLGHNIEFISRYRRVPKDLNDTGFQETNHTPWYLEYAANVDFKLAYGSSAAYTITLASLATSSTLVAGREGTAVSNTTNLYLDYLIASKIQVGTSPTAGTVIEVWSYASQNDTPLYPDVFDGTDSAETATSRAILQSSLALVALMAVDATTSNRDYFHRPVSAAMLWGQVPKNHGLFVTHNTGVNLNSTGGNHICSYTGCFVTG